MPTPALSSHEYPELTTEFFWEWGPIRAQFEPIETLPPADMISNVRVVPFVGEKVIVIYVRDWDGQWDHPGGTLEPGETYLQAAERELMEEAGARLIEFTPFGVFHCWSEAEKPYRPHLPFPEFYHVAGFADVERVSDRGNPSDGETISEVASIDLDEACRRLGTRHDGDWQAELYRLAASIRASR